MVTPPPPPVAALVQKCAPFVRTKTMTAIVKVESGGNPLIMYDNSNGRQYRPATVAQATAILNRLLKRGDQLDAGIAQIDSVNFAHYGLNSSNVFDACTNISVGARIFESGYRMSIRAGYAGEIAEYHAFEAYNSGRLFGDARYADAVFRAAGIPVYIHVSPGYVGNGNAGIDGLVFHEIPEKEYAAPFGQNWNSSKPDDSGNDNPGDIAWNSIPKLNPNSISAQDNAPNNLHDSEAIAFNSLPDLPK